jgi:hypothetical protein
VVLLLPQRRTILDKKLQADMVIHRLLGHPSEIKKKIMTQMEEELIVGNENGVENLLNFLDDIYKEKDMVDENTDLELKKSQDMDDHPSVWHNTYQDGCEDSDAMETKSEVLITQTKNEDVDTCTTSIEDLVLNITTKNTEALIDSYRKRMDGQVLRGTVRKR